MRITKTANRIVECGLDTQASDGKKWVIIIEREAPGPVRKSMNRKWSHDAVSLSDVEFTKCVRRALSGLQYSQMADIVEAIYYELKNRNPIGVNMYTGGLAQAHKDLLEVSAGEAGNFTSESGPKEAA